MATSPTTVLEAVNTMLSSIGEAPVNSLASGFEDAELAESIINNVNREVQSKGFVFNTDLEYTLFPGSDGTVHLPANILRVDTTKLVRSSEEDIVERGRKLYDRKNNTFWRHVSHREPLRLASTHIGPNRPTCCRSLCLRHPFAW